MSPGRIAARHRIRVARAGDLAALLRLQQIFETDRMTPRALAEGLRSPSRLVLVAERSGEVCGSAVAFLRRRSRTVRLYDLAVAAAARRTGVGSALVLAVERRAKDAGAASVHLEVRIENVSAQEFYRHAGYTVFGRYQAYYQDGCDALRMRKLLLVPRVRPATSPSLMALESHG